MVGVIVWLLLSVIVLLSSGLSRVPPRGGCGTCGYSLEGLRSNRCPECGATQTTIRSDGRLRLFPEGPSGYNWLATVAFGVCGAASLYFIALHVIACSYRVMGYSWETSYRAARLRELGSTKWEVWLGAEILWPCAVVLVLSPLCALFPRLRTTMLSMIAGMAVGVLVSAVMWIVPYV